MNEIQIDLTQEGMNDLLLICAKMDKTPRQVISEIIHEEALRSGIVIDE